MGFRRIIFAIFPITKEYYRFLNSITNKVSLWQWVKWKISRDKRIYWPVHPVTEVTGVDNIYVGYGSNPGTRAGCYIQGNGGLYIGNYVAFASNVALISSNHDVYDQSKYTDKEVILEDYCWIASGAMIMPGVHLGPRTIVAANSVVTHSFPDGYCIVGGNPAKLIKELDPEKFHAHKFREEFYGFIPKEKFKKFAKRHLSNNRYIDKILSKN